jgi:hypothetical protein
MTDLEDIEDFENEGGMVYRMDKPCLPFVPPWACPLWGTHEHDWLDCMDCQANYEVYLEENERERLPPPSE